MASLVVLGQLKAPLVKTLIKEQESVAFPEKTFYPVRSCAAEKKQDILLMRIEIIFELYKTCQTFCTTPEIGVPNSQHYLGE